MSKHISDMDLLRAKDRLNVETLCEVMHDAYEKAAVGAGWETQTASRKPWADVPEANKATMRAAVTALLDHLYKPSPVDGDDDQDGNQQG